MLGFTPATELTMLPRTTSWFQRTGKDKKREGGVGDGRR